jgi:hypothetical protein
MSIHDEIAADAANIFAEFGKEILLGGQSLRALISEPQETLELEAGGFTASGNFTVKVLRSSLPAARFPTTEQHLAARSAGQMVLAGVPANPGARHPFPNGKEPAT